MQKIFDVTQKVFQTVATVLLTGETDGGSSPGRSTIRGRARTASSWRRTVGRSSTRSSRRALRAQGSFTGAHTDKKGSSRSPTVTIFLDEIETELESRSACFASSRTVRSDCSAPPTRRPSTSGWRRRTAISRRWWRTGASGGPLLPPACRRARCPRSGSASRTSSPSRTTFSTRPPSGWAGSSSGSERRHGSARRPGGRATFASSPTKSSGRRRSRARRDDRA